ncbi:MAG: hypothetical protein KAW52_00330 [candidate division Zixibacteria bacterium]|nr:hypothetical protein [candidate division Zixibacteria bacterium]
MDKEQKTLKTPLSAKLAEIKAEAAGEAQKSLAREVLAQIYLIKIHLRQLDHEIYALENLMKEVLK